MKRLILFLLLTTVPVASLALAAPDNVYQQIDNLYYTGLQKRCATCGLPSLEASLDLCTRALAENPSDYELMWRYIRSAAEYCETAQSLREELPEWKEICREWGKKGLDMATRAQELEPDRVEAYYWRTMAMGKLADATSIITAIKEGFLPKTKSDILTAYELNKSYYDWIPCYAYCMFLSHLPLYIEGSPRKKMRKALDLYREYDAHTDYRNVPESEIRAVYGGEFLLQAIDTLNIEGAEKDEMLRQARDLFKWAASSEREYYSQWAQQFLNDKDYWM